METCYRGAYVISWSQTELDGIHAAPLDALAVGATWHWRGDMVRIDGPTGVLRLEQAGEAATRRRCASKLVRRLVKTATSGATRLEQIEDSDPASDTGFVVTDGMQAYSVTLVNVGGNAPPLLMFIDDIPPRGARSLGDPSVA